MPIEITTSNIGSSIPVESKEVDAHPVKRNADVAATETTQEGGSTDQASEGQTLSKDASDQNVEQVPAADTDPEKQPDAKQFSKRMAALAKQERQLQAEKQRTKQEVDEAKRILSTYNHVKDNPHELAKLLGHENFSEYFEKLVEFALAEDSKSKNPEADKLSELDKKMKAFEERQEAAAKKNEYDRIENTINEFKSSIQAHLKTNQDKYELINLHDAHDEVYNIIEEYFKQHNQVLDIVKAADIVEDYYYQRDQKLLSAKKFSGLGAQTSNTNRDSANANTNDVKAKPSKTLTNKVSASISPDVGPIDREEARKRTIERLRKEQGWK